MKFENKGSFGLNDLFACVLGVTVIARGGNFTGSEGSTLISTDGKGQTDEALVEAEVELDVWGRVINLDSEVASSEATGDI